MIEPLFESKPDHTIMYRLRQEVRLRRPARRQAGRRHAKIKVVKDKDGWDEPEPEDILREINRGMWTIGYTGQSPERLKLHMRNMHDVRREDAARQGRAVRRRLLRPAVAVLRHAGDQASGLAQPVRPVAARDGRRRLLPRQLRHRARRRQPAGRGRLVSRRAPSSPPATRSSTTCC